MKSFYQWAILAILASSYSLAMAGDCGCSDPCDACDPCAKKPGLLSKLFHKKCDTCDTCDTCATCEEPAPASDACEADPCDDFCDPCAKNKPLLGFLFKKRICGTCEPSCCEASCCAPSCCEAAPTCNSCSVGCGIGRGGGLKSIFSLRRPRPWVLAQPCCDCSGQGTIIHKSPSCCH